jgi:hypothetical protein
VDANCISARIENFTTRFNRKLKEIILLAHHGSQAADSVLEFVVAIRKVIEEQPWIESVVVRYQPSARYSPISPGDVPLKARLAAIIEAWSARNINVAAKLRDELWDDPPASL